MNGGSESEIIEKCISELLPLKSPRHWLSSTHLSQRVGISKNELEAILIPHAESKDWIVRYCYYPSGESLELLWGHKIKVGKQKNLPSPYRTEAPESGDLGPDNFQSWIFISHNSKDEKKVREISKIVESCEYGAWIFQQQIEKNEQIIGAVATAINECSHFIVYLSKNSLPSLWVDKELRVHLGFSDQETEKKTILVIDDYGKEGIELANIVEGVIRGNPDCYYRISEILGFPGEKKIDRAHQLLSRIEENKANIHVVRVSGFPLEFKDLVKRRD